ncbi:hypothetical protein SOVF_182690 isoform B [Spinacia oleracea]|uniref:J domain-containing protein required for chloroplast accumulation response 1 isoform X2 n=1 Tax=Spinacia oleracea TaxID=3562 RepID=A0A9R0IF50_SPIOL|nr:J domain-containing protein required for chloroplast accumulation response 1 isoform X2 [Spinacia oleracea]KNA06274.1 hypothetical protein SOVF_182690 isoform B [Spinacia oleracea]
MEKVLLGYGSSNSMSNSSSRRDSEVDFSDVFGGPPRCSSTHEFYLNDSVDGDDDSRDGLRNSWSGLREKPVFGEEIGVRRRYTNEDFYGDIFGGDQPLLSSSVSPKMLMPGRNPFSSAPGSRLMSPSRPATESCPAPLHFSLPGRTAIPDTMASTSMNQSSNLSRRSLSRFNQTIQNYSEIHDDQPSAMSSQVSVDGNESTSNNKLDGAEYEGEVIVNSKGSQFHNNNIQFHFSIYKWPSKGVQYVMSSKRISSKERMTDDRYLSSSEGIGSAYLVMENNKEGVIVNESVSSSKRQMPSTSNDDTVVHETSADVTGSGPVMFDATYQVGEAPPSIGLEDTKQVPILSQKLSDAVAEDSSLKHSSKKTKSNMMSLASLFGEEKKGKKKAASEKGGKKKKVNETDKVSVNDEISSYKDNKSKVQNSSAGAEENDDISSNKNNNVNKSKVHKSSAGAKESDDTPSNNVNKSKVHKSSSGAKENGETSSNNVRKSKVHNSSAGAKEGDDTSNNTVDKRKVVQKSSTGAKNDVSKNDAAGKVKDFVKIFNQDSTSKEKSNIAGKSRSWRWKNTTNSEAKNEVKTSSADNHDEVMQASYVNLDKTWSESIQVVDGESFLSVDQVFIFDDSHRVGDTTTSASNTEPNTDDIRASSPKINATSSIDDILDKGLLQDIETELATDSQEENKGYESKVRQWSKGKEGNIRALLSTMQFVLWPNSGWKPIPLVDIIEANAVKKAYQRALLCLHPDKLQQKGAAPYQKFIAEKVFDILQESWDQFNAIGLLS